MIYRSDNYYCMQKTLTTASTVFKTIWMLKSKMNM